MHVATFNEKTGINLKTSKERYVGRFGEREEKGEMTSLYYYHKNKR